MGKKTPQDRIRAELSRKSLLKRRALDGPFRCPKCQVGNSLQYQKKTKKVKRMRTPINKEPYEITINNSLYLFYCNKCNFRQVIERGPGSQIIDVYNALYDEEISMVDREGQISLIRDSKPRTLTLLATKVRM